MAEAPSRQISEPKVSNSNLNANLLSNMQSGDPFTISRPEILVDGSDHQFRHLMGCLNALFARHQAISEGHGSFIGLSGIHYTVLTSIRHLQASEGDVNVTRVAEHLRTSPGWVTKVTNQLEENGLVNKSEDPDDRRRIRLSVTHYALELLNVLAPSQLRVSDVQLDCMDTAEFTTFLDLVERFIASSDRALALQTYLIEEKKRSAGPSSRFA
jgi:MarR family transcriptional regulator, organic hydroperoxide resistance regulator